MGRGQDHLAIRSLCSTIVSVCIATQALCADLPEAVPGNHRNVLSISGIKREYVVHIPSDYDSARKFPVVLMYHGGGGKAEGAMVETGWTAKADAAGFIAVFPEGMRHDLARTARFVGNPQTWNDGSGRFYSGENGVDDIGFTRAILDDLEARYPVDLNRVYVTGFSNGASMAYRIGAELSSRIAAIAPVASSGLRIAQPQLLHPVSLLAIAGVDDPRNPPEGGNVISFGKSDSRPSIRTSIDTWAKLLDCPVYPAVDIDDHGLKTTVWQPCRDRSEVTFLLVSGMGHTWPGGRSLLPESLVGKVTHRISAVDVIWDFFRRHPRNTGGS